MHWVIVLLMTVFPDMSEQQAQKLGHLWMSHADRGGVVVQLAWEVCQQQNRPCARKEKP